MLGQKTVVTEVIAILDCINTPKRAKCAKKRLIGQILTALKPTCKQAVFKGSLCIRIGEAQETAHIDGCGVIIVACVIGLDGAVCAAVADGHFTGVLLNLTDKTARAGVHTVLACIKGAVPRAVFDQALVIGIADKAADFADAMGLCSQVDIGGDVADGRAVALQSVIGAVEAAGRADNTANIVNLGVHDNIAVDGEVLDRARSDLAEEAQTGSFALHVQALDGVSITVKVAAEVVAVFARRADGGPRSVFQIDIRGQNGVCRSVYGVDVVGKPEQLTCIADLIIAVAVQYGRLIMGLPCRAGTEALRIIAVYVCAADTFAVYIAVLLLINGIQGGVRADRDTAARGVARGISIWVCRPAEKYALARVSRHSGAQLDRRRGAGNDGGACVVILGHRLFRGRAGAAVGVIGKGQVTGINSAVQLAVCVVIDGRGVCQSGRGGRIILAPAHQLAKETGGAKEHGAEVFHIVPIDTLLIAVDILFLVTYQTVPTLTDIRSRTSDLLSEVVTVHTDRGIIGAAIQVCLISAGFAARVVPGMSVVIRIDFAK